MRLILCFFRRCQESLRNGIGSGGVFRNSICTDCYDYGVADPIYDAAIAENPQQGIRAVYAVWHERNRGISDFPKRNGIYGWNGIYTWNPGRGIAETVFDGNFFPYVPDGICA